MLETIRKSSHHYLFKLFFLLLAVIFAISLGDFNTTKSQIVVTVGNHKMSMNDFLIAKQDRVNQIRSKQELTQQQIVDAAPTINANVIESMVTKSMIEQEAKNLGLKVSPEVVADYIQKDNNFQRNNVFDINLYKNALEQLNVREEKFLSNLSLQISTRFLLESMMINLPLRSNINNYLYKTIAEKRLVSLFDVDASKSNITLFSDKDLKDFHEKNKNKFVTKEYRSFSYLLFSASELKKTLNITNEALKKEYDDNKEEYLLPQRRDFQHFLSPTEEIANKIVEDLRKNQNYKEVAKEFVAQKVISESFENQSLGSFVSNIDNTLFTRKLDDITDPMKSELGWHVFKITKIHPKQYKSFAEATQEITAKLENKMLEIQMYEMLKQVEDDIASGATFKEVAMRYSLISDQAVNIALDGSYKIENKVETNKDIIKMAFKMELDEESEVKPVGDTQDMVVIKVEAIENPVKLKFLEVQEDVKRQYLLKVRDKLALEVSNLVRLELSKENQKVMGKKNLNDELLQKILKPVYKKYKLSQSNQPVISVSNRYVIKPVLGDNGDLSPEFVDTLFSLGIKKVSVPQQLGYGQYGFAIIQNSIPMKDADRQIYDQVDEISTANYKNEIYEQYIAYLSAKYKVDVDYSLVNRSIETP
jgi:peptidyl-prolyl cis-trans isomerase D